MADELIDIYDKNNKTLDIQLMKSEAHKKWLWHRSAHIWIYNSKGEILLQLRAKDKELYPDMWDISVAGHVGAWEEEIISAIRETEEEIWLSVKTEDLEFFKIKKVKMIYKKMLNHEFNYIYFLKFDGDIKELALQKEEVAEIHFLPIEKIEKELKENPNNYAPHWDYWDEIIEKVKSFLV